ncbi:ribosome hibernation-promoting factor, HPF/YfiA family [Xanthocytophaga agilis]|nr:ribosome-associated translation inhibitor RaiA [Xanthocytophaga agilis]
MRMKLQMQSLHFDADSKLLAFIQKKAEKLDTFFGRIIDGEVILRLEKCDNKENKVFELRINVPGNQFFVKEKASTFEAATDLALETMKSQLRKHKEKLRSHKTDSNGVEDVTSIEVEEEF